MITAAVVGGTVSEVTGGKFANGAVTGAFSRAFNDEMHEFIEQVKEIREETRIVNAARDLEREDFITLFPSYKAAVDFYGLEFAKDLLSQDFRLEVLSGRLLETARQGGDAISEHAKQRVLGSLGTGKKSIQVIGRALNLSEEQIRVYSDIHSVRSALGRTRASASSLSDLANELKELKEQNNEP